MINTDTIRTYPNRQEEEFLNIAINRFLDISEELEPSKTIDSKLRFALLVQIMTIYTEVLNYKPIKKYLEYIDKSRPPEEFTAYKYLEVLRHILVHFNFYPTWNDVRFSRRLITWTGKHSKIDKFLTKYENSESFKWRVWNENERVMNYGYQFNFPKGYSEGKTIYLKDLVDEDKGIDFSIALIQQMLESQILSIKELKSDS